MKSAGAVAALILGLVLLAASALWGTLFPAANVWTDEKSQQLSELGSQTNFLKFELVEAKQNPSMHAGRNPAEIQTEYDSLRDAYDQLQVEFETARDRPHATARVLRWVGVVLVALGAVGALMK